MLYIDELLKSSLKGLSEQEADVLLEKVCVSVGAGVCGGFCVAVVGGKGG